MADFFAFFVFLFLRLILDLIFFYVIRSFQDVSGWKLRKIVRDLFQAQKGNSYRVILVYATFLCNTRITNICDLHKKEFCHERINCS